MSSLGNSGPPSELSPTERALKESLTKTEFRDVHLYAFTRRTVYLGDGSSKIGHPLPVLAIGSILKDSEHFAKLLTSGFAESQVTADPSVAIREYALADEYDYESDSDLDECEEAEDTPTPGSSKPPMTPDSKGKRKDEESSAPDEDKKHLAEGRPPQHRILLPSVAHKTLCACVFYLYTGKVNFMPLRSAGPSQRQFSMLTAGGSTKAPLCSPKSMYRLAESYGITNLQDFAYNAILARLTPANIVEEAFSRFFARYDRLREHAVSYLSQNYSDLRVQASLQDALDKVLMGQAPHAGPLLRSLLGLRIATAPPTHGGSLGNIPEPLVKPTSSVGHVPGSPIPSASPFAAFSFNLSSVAEVTKEPSSTPSLWSPVVDPSPNVTADDWGPTPVKGKKGSKKR
ncbi:hypothetical protein VTO73DRAFT_14373 [Trametes versicolor]